MNRFEHSIGIVVSNFEKAPSGIFNTRNFVGDNMTTLYKDNELQIDICYDYGYFEVFGLTNEEFCRLSETYEYLRNLSKKDREKLFDYLLK